MTTTVDIEQVQKGHKSGCCKVTSSEVTCSTSTCKHTTLPSYWALLLRKAFLCLLIQMGLVEWAKPGSHKFIQAGKSVPGLLPISVPQSKLCSG